MKTVTKALALLDLFSETEPEFGLTALARKAEVDKATTLRLLRALKGHGFIEQDDSTRRYRLGASLLRLARLREATVPMIDSIQPVLQKLTRDSGETSYAALAAGNSLAVVAVAHSSRAARVNIAPGLKLPFHATASGIAFLAFTPPGTFKNTLQPPLKRFTDMTTTDLDDVRKLVETARKGGVGSVDRGFEADVVDLAVPVFDGSGQAQGAIALVTPISRMGLNVRHEQSEKLLRAALDCAQRMGAMPPKHFSDLVPGEDQA